MRTKFLPLLTLSLVLFSAQSYCQQDAQVKVPKNDKIKLDGKVSSEEISGASKLELTVLGNRAKPSNPTELYAAATDSGLYFGFVSKSQNDNYQIKALKPTDAVFDDESVQVFITPNQEATSDNYFHFAVNPKGVAYSNRADKNTPVLGWESKVSTGTKEWQAEFFIPLSSIQAALNQPYWRANFARLAVDEGKKPEVSAWISPGVSFDQAQASGVSDGALSLHNYKRFGFLTVPSFVPAAPKELNITKAAAQ